MLVQFQQRGFPPTKEIRDVQAIHQSNNLGFFLSETPLLAAMGKD
jgi:hypothetical protein